MANHFPKVGYYDHHSYSKSTNSMFLSANEVNTDLQFLIELNLENEESKIVKQGRHIGGIFSAISQVSNKFVLWYRDTLNGTYYTKIQLYNLSDLDVPIETLDLPGIIGNVIFSTTGNHLIFTGSGQIIKNSPFALTSIKKNQVFSYNIEEALFRKITNLPGYGIRQIFSLGNGKIGLNYVHSEGTSILSVSINDTINVNNFKDNLLFTENEIEEFYQNIFLPMRGKRLISYSQSIDSELSSYFFNVLEGNSTVAIYNYSGVNFFDLKSRSFSSGYFPSDSVFVGWNPRQAYVASDSTSWIYQYSNIDPYKRELILWNNSSRKIEKTIDIGKILMPLEEDYLVKEGRSK